MRALVIHVPASSDVEEVMDILVPLAPRGVHELEAEEGTELVLYGGEQELPDADELEERFGAAIGGVETRAAPEGWRERRLETYRARPIADRLLVRPEWAPAPPAGLVDVVVAEGDSFGTGAHPTTRACLALIAILEPGGALADLGCGSGVLAVAAARLGGWSRVIAVDLDPAAVEATDANAERNDVDVEAGRLDLSTEPPPAARTAVANVQIEVHEVVAPRLDEVTERVIASGVEAGQAEALVTFYESAGFAEQGRIAEGGWVALLMAREW